MSTDQETSGKGKGGPRTAAGKQAVSGNACKHGILASSPVIPGVECQEEWEEHRDGFFASLRPVGALESHLAERVALNFWRLQRVTRHERDGLTPKELAGQRDWLYHKVEGDSALGRLEGLRDTALYMVALPVLPHTQIFHPSTAAHLLTTVARGVEYQTEWEPWMDQPTRWNSFPDFAVYQERLLARLGAGPVTEAHVAEHTPLTAEKLRALLAALGERVGLTPEEIQLKGDEETLETYKAAYRYVQEALPHQQRQSSLPDPDEQARITRYEAHLSRELYRALRELRALQSQRTVAAGLPTPPPAPAPQTTKQTPAASASRTPVTHAANTQAETAKQTFTRSVGLADPGAPGGAARTFEGAITRLGCGNSPSLQGGGRGVGWPTRSARVEAGKDRNYETNSTPHASGSCPRKPVSPHLFWGGLPPERGGTEGWDKTHGKVQLHCEITPQRFTSRPSPLLLGEGTEGWGVPSGWAEAPLTHVPRSFTPLCAPPSGG